MDFKRHNNNNNNKKPTYNNFMIAADCRIRREEQNAPRPDDAMSNYMTGDSVMACLNYMSERECNSPSRWRTTSQAYGHFEAERDANGQLPHQRESGRECHEENSGVYPHNNSGYMNASQDWRMSGRGYNMPPNAANGPGANYGRSSQTADHAIDYGDNGSNFAHMDDTLGDRYSRPVIVDNTAYAPNVDQYTDGYHNPYMAPNYYAVPDSQSTRDGLPNNNNANRICGPNMSNSAGTFQHGSDETFQYQPYDDMYNSGAAVGASYGHTMSDNVAVPIGINRSHMQQPMTVMEDNDIGCNEMIQHAKPSAIKECEIAHMMPSIVTKSLGRVHDSSLHPTATDRHLSKQQQQPFANRDRKVNNCSQRASDQNTRRAAPDKCAERRCSGCINRSKYSGRSGNN
ncbi:hypothetical protein ACOME3_010545 [Neoechinorhynchus agilis]